MRRRHIAVIAGSSNGHLYPTLPLCAELSKRGHRITLVVTEHYASIAAGVGAEPVIVETKPIPAWIIAEVDKTRFSSSANDPKVKELAKSELEAGFAKFNNIGLVHQVSDFYQENSPDVIVHDRYSYWARILAKQLGAPTVQLSPTFAYDNNLAWGKNGARLNPEDRVAWVKLIDSFLWEHGIETRDNYWHSEKLNIYFIPWEFQYHSECFDDRFCFVGAMLNRPYSRVWQNRSGGKPIMLVSSPSPCPDSIISDVKYFRAFVDGLSGTNWHCVLSTHDPKVERELGSLPENFEINRKASHLEILPHATLAVCHGGTGSTLEALYNGVPTLLFPSSHFCQEIADRVEDLGLGKCLSEERLTGRNVRDAAEEMLADDALSSRVKEMQIKFKNSGGAELAADRIEAGLIC